MADTEPTTLATRQRVISLARAQIGCHYVWGAAGNTPGASDGAYYRTNAVHMHANDSGRPDRRHPDHGRTQPIMFAATCNVDGYKVCAGRCNLQTIQGRPHGDANNQSHLNSSGFTWPRPEDVIDSAAIVWGESCEGIRHFDCIGFINWCLSQVVQPTHRAISQMITMTRDVGFDDIWVGDILTKGTTHIGFAAGAHTTVHASGTRVGVLENGIRAGDWDRVGRLSRGYWNGH